MSRYKEWIEKLCKQCNKKFEVTPCHIHRRKFCSPSCASIYNNSRRKRKKNYVNNNPLYDIHKNRIGWCEEIRRNPTDKNILQIRCRYCGKWTVPTSVQLNARYSALVKDKSNSYIYCSETCKSGCPVYRKSKWPKGFSPYGTSREVQPELRQMVFKRDNYICQKCGSTNLLHCHHIDGVNLNPIESADIDKCMTVCKDCHKEIHKQKDCGYNDMKCYKKNGIVKRNYYRYIIVSPEGKKHKIFYLSRWCKENQIPYSSILKLCNGKIDIWNGWICEKTWTKNRTKNKSYNKNWLYVFINPEKREIEIRNLNKFCKENHLPVSSFYQLTYGTFGDDNVRGWKYISKKLVD